VSTWWHEHNRELLDSGDRDMARHVLPAHLVNLLNAVEARFVSTTTVRSWPDPHAISGEPLRSRPTEEEYSRVTDPARYRVVHERADAWLAELVARDLATVEGVPASDAWLLNHHHHPDERVQRVVPQRDDALALLVESWGPGPDLPAGATIGAGSPAVLLEITPYCGCDACDDGSDRLLQQLDEAILHVVDGSLRVEMTADSTRLAYAGGDSASGHFDAVEQEARRAVLGSRTLTLIGRPWDSAWPPRQPSGA
jgi:hypothetical protein